MSEVSHDLFQVGLITSGSLTVFPRYSNSVKGPFWNSWVVFDRVCNLLYILYTLHLTISTSSYSFGDWCAVPGICCYLVHAEEVLHTRHKPEQILGKGFQLLLANRSTRIQTQILVRLEFELKLEPLLLYSPATPATPATPALF